MTRARTVGILALQGDFAEHAAMLRSLNAAHREVRLPAHLAGIDALIIPGGESTTMAKLMDAYALREPLRAFAHSGKPIWGTCAGMVLLANRLIEPAPEPLGLLDVTVHRNAFGRQVDSFEADLDVAGMGDPFHAIFIRAPTVTAVGDGIHTLASLDDGVVVAVRHDNLLATAFHPELTRDPRFHQLFLSMMEAAV